MGRNLKTILTLEDPPVLKMGDRKNGFELWVLETGQKLTFGPKNKWETYGPGFFYINWVKGTMYHTECYLDDKCLWEYIGKIFSIGWQIVCNAELDNFDPFVRKILGLMK